jgi:S-adenosylmethionine synthetase
MARFVAKNLVADGHAKEAIVSVAYAIGRADPLMVSAYDEEGRDITNLLSDYDFRPQEIIKRLGLRRPIYRATATYGHFGNDDLPWEKMVETKTNA